VTGSLDTYSLPPPRGEIIPALPPLRGDYSDIPSPFEGED